jgi:hypothetical protein
MEDKLLFVKGDRIMSVVSEKQRILREKNGTRRREGGMIREELVREYQGGDGHGGNLARCRACKGFGNATKSSENGR